MHFSWDILLYYCTVITHSRFIIVLLDVQSIEECCDQLWNCLGSDVEFYAAGQPVLIVRIACKIFWCLERLKLLQPAYAIYYSI